MEKYQKFQFLLLFLHAGSSASWTQYGLKNQPGDSTQFWQTEMWEFVRF